MALVLPGSAERRDSRKACRGKLASIQCIIKNKAHIRYRANKRQRDSDPTTSSDLGGSTGPPSGPADAAGGGKGEQPAKKKPMKSKENAAIKQSKLQLAEERAKLTVAIVNNSDRR